MLLDTWPIDVSQPLEVGTVTLGMVVDIVGVDDDVGVDSTNAAVGVEQSLVVSVDRIASGVSEQGVDVGVELVITEQPHLLVDTRLSLEDVDELSQE